MNLFHPHKFANYLLKMKHEGQNGFCNKLNQVLVFFVKLNNFIKSFIQADLF